jgi:hypothetical protein
MKKEVYTIIYDYRLADYCHEVEVVKVFTTKDEADDYLDKLERVMRAEYDWREHRDKYETIVREDNFVRSTYGTMSCEYRIERADLNINA